MVDHIPAHRYSNPDPFPPAHHHFQGYFNLILSEKHRTPSGTTGQNKTVKASENIYTNCGFTLLTPLITPKAQKQSTKPSLSSAASTPSPRQRPWWSVAARWAAERRRNRLVRFFLRPKPERCKAQLPIRALIEVAPYLEAAPHLDSRRGAMHRP